MTTSNNWPQQAIPIYSWIFARMLALALIISDLSKQIYQNHVEENETCNQTNPQTVPMEIEALFIWAYNLPDYII